MASSALRSAAVTGMTVGFAFDDKAAAGIGADDRCADFSQLAGEGEKSFPLCVV
jgi:hypothetical protein